MTRLLFSSPKGPRKLTCLLPLQSYYYPLCFGVTLFFKLGDSIMHLLQLSVSYEEGEQALSIFGASAIYNTWSLSLT
jgi:hypothetical protein